MPIDPNIPLQVKGLNLASPAEQLKMMASAAQLSEYQRGIGEQNALRDMLSSGIDIKSPEALKQMYQINPTMGMNFEKRQAELGKLSMEGKKLVLDVDEKKMGLFRERIGNLAFNPSNANIQAHIEDAVLRGEVTSQDAQARLTQSLSIPMGQRAAYFNDMSVKTEERYKAATTKRGQDMSAGTAAKRLEFDRQQAQNPEMQLVQMEDGSYAGVNKRTGQAMPINMGQPPVNALAPSAPTQGDGSNMLAPTVAPTTAPAPQPLRGKPNVGTLYPFIDEAGKTQYGTAAQVSGKTPATAATEKTAQEKVKTVRELDLAISNINNAIKPGGLLDQSTGSGLGAAADATAGFFGKSTEGARAIAQLKPIADLALKMVPRFEGPQSDKDTQTYRDAAGELSNASLPVETRREAAKTVTRLMKERRDAEAGGGAGSAGGAPIEATNGKDVIVSFDGGKTWKPKGEK
jgi:hypothetical protein